MCLLNTDVLYLCKNDKRMKFRLDKSDWIEIGYYASIICAVVAILGMLVSMLRLLLLSLR